MKDTPKKLGAVALAGVMVAGGTLQSGAVVSNAEGVNDRASTKVSTMSDSGVDVYDFNSVYQKTKKTWSEVWTSELRDRKNMHYRQIYGDIHKNYRDKIEILALGRKTIVDTILEETQFAFRDLDFQLVRYNYNTLEELKTGKPINDDRVANIKGVKLDYGGTPISKFEKGKFYKIEIGRPIMDSKPVCHIFLYVKK